MSRTLDLFTGTAVSKQKTVKSGLKGSMLRPHKPRTINGVCYYCRKAISDDDASRAIPLMVGWLHYKCYVDMHCTNTLEAKRMAALDGLAA